MHRTHNCNELRASDEGKEVTLSGWVHRRRDLGEMIFISLRDAYGLTQLVFDPKINGEAHEIAEDVRSEWVIKVIGKVNKRLSGQERQNEATGEVEVKVEKVEILSKALTPPFEINNEEKDVSEDLRLKYRYLDLRRPKQVEKIRFRSQMNHFTRNWFTDNKFLEVQTPIFTVSSPEGARDYLIPSRVHKGKFYALPQAPQQYKQLLMVSGVDKYFQIAPCFRDEDPRSDRHCCEFYQLDVEMSFVEQEDVFKIAEGYLSELVKNLVPHKHITQNSFQKIPYIEAINRFGSDKPDARFGMELQNLDTVFSSTSFNLFSNTLENGDSIKAICLSGHTLSRKEIDALTDLAVKSGAGGLPYLIYDEELRGSLAKFISEDELKQLSEVMGFKKGDTLLFAIGENKSASKVLGNLRLELRDRFSLAKEDELACVWVVDFPIFEEKDGHLDFEHNPFSMPQGGMEALNEKNPLDIYGYQYDLSINGYEILSGSIRNHSPEILLKLFSLVGKSEDDVKEKFGGMYNAFCYGAPPHGGFAFGFDRLMMILLDEENIRDIYAFPKSTNAQDLMMGAPSEVNLEDLVDLNIKLEINSQE